MSRVCATRQSSSYVSGAHRKRIAQVQVVNVGQSARKRLERFCGHRTRAAEQSVARDHGHGRGAHR